MLYYFCKLRHHHHHQKLSLLQENRVRQPLVRSSHVWPSKRPIFDDVNFNDSRESAGLLVFAAIFGSNRKRIRRSEIPQDRRRSIFYFYKCRRRVG